MWLFLVAAGSGYLIGCYQKAIRASTPISDSNESVKPHSSLPCRSNVSDETEAGDFPEEIDKRDEAIVSGKNVSEIDTENKGTRGKYLDWRSLEKKCSPLERKLISSIDWRDHGRLSGRQFQKDVPGKYAPSSPKRGCKNLQFLSIKELSSRSTSSDFHKISASTSQSVAGAGTNKEEASDVALSKPLCSGDYGHHVENADLEQASESGAKVPLAPSSQTSCGFALSNWNKTKGVTHRIEEIEREEANDLFLQTQGLSLISKKRKGLQRTNLSSPKRLKEDVSEGLVGHLLGTLLFSFGVGVGLFLSPCKFNDVNEPHQQNGDCVQETKSDFEAESSFTPKSCLSLQVAEGHKILSRGKISHYEELEGLHELTPFGETKFVTKKPTEDVKCSSAVAVKHELHEVHMSELEAELQAELDILQTRFVNEDSPEEQRELLDLLLDWTIRAVDEEAISDFQKTFCTEEAEIHSAQIVTQNQAVSPWELDRRLRILLESRQEERMSELEAEISSLLEKLRLKDQELQMWKDRFQGMMIGSQASSSDVKRMISSNSVTAGLLFDRIGTSTRNDSSKGNNYSETCRSWLLSPDKNPEDKTESLKHSSDEVSNGNVHTTNAVCGSVLGPEEAMGSARCCTNRSNNCSSRCQCFTLSDFSDQSSTNDGAISHLISSVNTNGREQIVRCTVPESGRQIDSFEVGKFHTSTPHDRFSRSNKELVISLQDNKTVHSTKSEAFLARDPFIVSSSCLTKATDSKINPPTKTPVEILQKGNQGNAIKAIDRQLPSLRLSSATDVQGFPSNKGEFLYSPNMAPRYSTESPLVQEESSTVDDILSEELFLQFFERKKWSSKIFKDARSIISMFERDEQDKSDDEIFEALVHLSKTTDGDKGFSKEEQQNNSDCEGCNYVEPSNMSTVRENSKNMVTRVEKRDILEEFFDTEEYIKFKSIIE